MDTHTGHAVYGVGGGITWQSQASAEHAEVLTKTAVLRSTDRDIELPGGVANGPGRGVGNPDLVECPGLRPPAGYARRTITRTRPGIGPAAEVSALR